MEDSKAEEKAKIYGTYDAEDEKGAEEVEDMKLQQTLQSSELPREAESPIIPGGNSQISNPITPPESVILPPGDNKPPLSESKSANSVPEAEFTITKCTRIPQFNPKKVAICSGCCAGIFSCFSKRESSFRNTIVGALTVGVVAYGLTRLYNSITQKLRKQRYSVELLTPSFNLQDIVDRNNSFPTFCPSSLLLERAVLVGTYVTEMKEARPIRHQASRVDKKTLVQAWEIERNGMRIPLVVNGSLLAECMSDLHSDDVNAKTAALRARTKNVCHLNLPSAIQAIVNPNTFELAKFILGVDFQ